MILVWIFSALACALWFILFSPWMSGQILFWPMMVAATGFLAFVGFLAQQERTDIYRLRIWHVLAGVCSALLLYGIFYLGRKILVFVFPTSVFEIEDVYGIRHGAPAGLIAFLLLFWIGPAEEIFWRGFIQERCMKNRGSWKGLVLATLIYMLVHVSSLNFTLVLASGVCGFWWGLQFSIFRNLWPVIIAHAVWDVMIFVAWPMNA